MGLRYTKTFVENRFYTKVPGGQPGQWQELPRAQTHEAPIDEQIAQWVRQTGSQIVHPGQLGIHTSWHDTHLMFKCVTLGLTVLYETAESGHGEQESDQTNGGRRDGDGAIAGGVHAAVLGGAAGNSASA